MRTPEAHELIDAAADPVAALKAAFDGSFALPPPTARTGDSEAVVLVRAGRGQYALPAGGLVAVGRATSITPVPSRAPALLGLCTHRGAVVPAYSLARLVGDTDGADVAPWLAIVRDAVVALAFDRLERFLEVPRAQLMATGSLRTRQAIAVGSETAFVVDTRALVETIREQTLAATSASNGRRG